MAGLAAVALAPSGALGQALETLPIPEGPRLPVGDPLARTVLGTPEALRAELPAFDLDSNLRAGRVRIFPDRKVPEVFWYAEGLEYLLAEQPGPAPLVFVIGGTGSSAHGDGMILLMRGLYAAGMHVVSIASPTFPGFIVSASETSVPGRLPEDAEDLYRAMMAVLSDIGPLLPVTGFRLAGYSLGGAHAAFLAKLDAQERAFNFEKVLLINPPVDLLRSVRILDAMFDRHLRDDPQRVALFIERLMNELGELYLESGQAAFDGDFLYRAYARLPPDDDRLETLIGLYFRLLANDMSFTADVMTGGGYIVPRGREPGFTSSLTPYLTRGLSRSFEDYFEELYFPFYKARDPDFDQQEALAELRLAHVEPFLRQARHLGVFTNRDDIILAPGDLDWLQRVMGPRLRVFEHGGHLGNFQERAFVDALAAFFGA
ncbi:hypothetical protein SH611_15865 [Geminicoccaceae bacterium 1502E]|nr:hypothetical protein [Geminicoccaceae bacterium 1502E]